MNSIQVSVIFVVCLLAGVRGTPFQDCGSTGATITAVKVEGCDTLPCIVHKGQNVSFEMDFDSKSAFEAAETKITAIIGSIPIPYSPPDPNACHFMTCPVKSGDHVTYKTNLALPSAIPNVKVIVQWELVNGGDVITCFKVSVQTE